MHGGKVAQAIEQGGSGTDLYHVAVEVEEVRCAGLLDLLLGTQSHHASGIHGLISITPKGVHAAANESLPRIHSRYGHGRPYPTGGFFMVCSRRFPIIASMFSGARKT